MLMTAGVSAISTPSSSWCCASKQCYSNSGIILFSQISYSDPIESLCCVERSSPVAKRWHVQGMTIWKSQTSPQIFRSSVLVPIMSRWMCGFPAVNSREGSRRWRWWLGKPSSGRHCFWIPGPFVSLSTGLVDLCKPDEGMILYDLPFSIVLQYLHTTGFQLKHVHPPGVLGLHAARCPLPQSHSHLWGTAPGVLAATHGSTLRRFPVGPPPRGRGDHLPGEDGGGQMTLAPDRLDLWVEKVRDLHRSLRRLLRSLENVAARHCRATFLRWMFSGCGFRLFSFCSVWFCYVLLNFLQFGELP